MIHCKEWYFHTKWLFVPARLLFSYILGSNKVFIEPWCSNLEVALLLKILKHNYIQWGLPLLKQNSPAWYFSFMVNRFEFKCWMLIVITDAHLGPPAVTNELHHLNARVNIFVKKFRQILVRHVGKPQLHWRRGYSNIYLEIITLKICSLVVCYLLNLSRYTHYAWPPNAHRPVYVIMVVADGLEPSKHLTFRATTCYWRVRKAPWELIDGIISTLLLNKAVQDCQTNSWNLRFGYVFV